MLKRLLVGSALLLALLVTWQHQAIADWWTLQHYHPPAAVSQLAVQASMTTTAKHDFYLSQPAIQDKRPFAASCPVTEQGLVLGCYTSHHIYILNITKAELSKVMQVTAAHETLHAAYERLSIGRRREVNAWLNDYYANHASAELRSTIKKYDKEEPGQRLNELHSLVGTQEKDLPSQLEDYYKAYFKNRQQVVSAYQAYRGVFKSLEDQAKLLKAQIDSYTSQLTALEATLEQEQANINAINQRMDSYRQSGNIDAYNELVPTQNSLVREYNAHVSSYKYLVAAYNAKVEEYNSVGLRQNGLLESLDASKFKPAH